MSEPAGARHAQGLNVWADSSARLWPGLRPPTLQDARSNDFMTKEWDSSWRKSGRPNIAPRSERGGQSGRALEQLAPALWGRLLPLGTRRVINGGRSGPTIRAAGR